jgi:HAD superfamily phosphoserine phosphatase-like hydrolase
MTQGNRKLAIFDVEGVLIPKKRYLLFEVGRHLRFSQFAVMVFYGMLYELYLNSLKSAMKHMFKAFKGFRIEELLRIFRQIPLMPGAEEVFEKLRGEGWKTALISSGLPTLVVRDLASRLKADYAYGFELEMKDKVVRGEIYGEALEKNGKLLILKEILETEGLAPEDCVVIADDRNNASILLPSMLKIGYDPDFLIRIKADRVVTGKLDEILSPMNGQAEANQTLNPFKNEILREIIHASGATIPVLSSLLGVYSVSFFIIIVTLFYVMSQLATMERKSLPVISQITRHAATPGETYEFITAPIFFAFGILLTLLLFPAPASSAAIAIFALGDSAASIFGRMIGRKTLFFNKGKTIEGSLLGFFFAFVAGTFFLNPLGALVGAVVAMVVETLPLPVNDNLTIPLITGFVLTLMV